MTLNVLITSRFPDELLAQIQAISPEINLAYAPLKPRETLPLTTVAETEVLYTWSNLPQPEEAPKLRWVQLHSAGIDHVQGHPILDCDIALTTTSGIHAVPIAEYVISTILAWSHRLPRMLTYQKREIWPGGRWDKFVSTELLGATIGILGYGSVGRQVARLAHAFGMRILVTKRDPRRIADPGYMVDGAGDPNSEFPARIYPAAATLSMLPECDFVVLCAPLIAETYHMINTEALKAMKSTTYLVNVGRGKLIDEAALVEALEKGWIGGAGLDVFEVEPLSTNSPLWKLDNVILSPHVAGFSPNSDSRAIDVFGRNLRRYLENRPLLNLVNKEHGY